MKVLLINGSPHNDGCVKRALEEINNELKKEGIEGVFYDLDKTTYGCIDCKYCFKNKKCFREDSLNNIGEILDDIDGIVVGSPVYYASPNGALIGFLDRLFRVYGHKLQFKPACAISSARRAGTTPTMDVINKYFSITNMPIVSSNYWNMVHGGVKEDVERDEEGLQIMRGLGRNMAWILNSIDIAKKNGINHPEVEIKIKTNI